MAQALTDAPGNGDSATATSPRVLRRRRELPGGRAVVGGFLVAVAAVGIFAAFQAATAEPATRFVTAADDVEVGTQLTADDLELTPIDLPDAVAGGVFTEPDVVVGATAVGPIFAGELVQASDLVATGDDPGRQQLSFAVSASRALGGAIQPGERVDVLATYGSGEDAVTTRIVEQVLVLRASEGDDQIVGGSGLRFVVSLDDPDQALALANAVDTADLTVVRTTAARSGGAGRQFSPSRDVREPGR